METLEQYYFYKNSDLDMQEKISMEVICMIDLIMNIVKILLDILRFIFECTNTLWIKNDKTKTATTYFATSIVAVFVSSCLLNKKPTFQKQPSVFPNGFFLLLKV